MIIVSEQMVSAINTQIGHELANSNFYVAIAAYFDREGLTALTEFFMKQGADERIHAMKFTEYVNDVGGTLSIPSIPAPQVEVHSAAEGVRLALEREYETTDQIKALAAQACDEGDFVTRDFLVWFTQEQIEEVSSLDKLLHAIERVGEDNLVQIEVVIASLSK